MSSLSATTLGLFTTSWLALGLSSLNAPGGSTSVTLGIYLFGFGTAAGILALLSLMGKPFFTLLLSIAVARMVLDGLYEVGAIGKHGLHAAGWFGLVLAGLAMYGGAAPALEDARRGAVLPLFRRGEARGAFERSYEEHLQQLESEPGVRPQL